MEKSKKEGKSSENTSVTLSKRNADLVEVLANGTYDSKSQVINVALDEAADKLLEARERANKLDKLRKEIEEKERGKKR